jgi:hypothetical protein
MSDSEQDDTFSASWQYWAEFCKDNKGAKCTIIDEAIGNFKSGRLKFRATARKGTTILERDCMVLESKKGKPYILVSRRAPFDEFAQQEADSLDAKLWVASQAASQATSQAKA